jgi:hypothetical protein
MRSTLLRPGSLLQGSIRSCAALDHRPRRILHRSPWRLCHAVSPVQRASVVRTGFLVLAAGSYKASPTVANSTQGAAFAVAGQPGMNLLTLSVSPSVVNQQTSFSVVAELDDAPPQEIAVPMRVSIGGGPQFIWIYSQLIIAPGVVREPL